MKKLCTLLFACCAAIAVWGVDFSTTVGSGQKLWFRVIDASAKTAMVWHDGSTYRDASNKPTGDLVIPATVVNPDDGETYTITGVGGSAFYVCDGLTSVEFPTAAAFTTIDTYAFRGTGLTEIVIPDNVTTLGQESFEETQATKVSIGVGVTDIPEKCFNGNKKLTRIAVPDNVESIGRAALTGCDELRCIELGSGVQKLYYESLAATNLAYMRNDKLDTIIVHATTPPTAEAWSISRFDSELCKRVVLYVPELAVETYKSNAQWGQFSWIYAEGTEVNFIELTVYNPSHDDNTSQGTVYINGTQVDHIYSYSYNANRTIRLVAGEATELEVRPTHNRLYWDPIYATLGEDTITLNSEHKATFYPTETAQLRVSYDYSRLPYDFTEPIPSGQLLYFTVTDAVNKKVKIVNQTGGRSTSGYQSYAYLENKDKYKPKGDLVVPTEITHEGVTYTVNEIDTLAFGKCMGISSVEIPEGIEIIRAGAFMNADRDYSNSGIKGSLFLPQSCTVVESDAFRGNSITEVDLGGMTELSQYVLLYNPIKKISGMNIESLMIRSLQLIDLEEVVLGENCKYVSSYTFYNNQKVKSVTLYATTPPAVKYYASDVDVWNGFNPSEATLYVPKSVDHSVLDAYKVANCWKLFGTIEEMPDKYTITAGVAAGSEGKGHVSGGGAYVEDSEVQLKAVPVAHYQFVEWQDGNTDNPRTITVSGDATYTATFAAIPTAVGDTLIGYVDGFPVYAKVTSVSPKEVQLFGYKTWAESFTASLTTPVSMTDYWGDEFAITSIAKDAFYSSRATEITISEGVRDIAMNAINIYNTYLTTLNLPASLQTMGETAFSYCPQLATVHFASTENLQNIDKQCFYKCKFMEDAENGWIIVDGVALGYKGTAPEKLIVPEEVTFIADLRSYPSHSLNTVKRVRLPHNLRGISKLAFSELYPQAVETFAATAPRIMNPDVNPYRPFYGREDGMTLQISCEADGESYRNDAYWGTYKTISTNMNLYTVGFTCNVDDVVSVTANSGDDCNERRLNAYVDNEAYEFDSWWDGTTDVDKVVTLTQDTTFQINVRKKTFEVVFVDEFGTELKRETYEYGDMPSCDTPTKEADETFTYTFDAWDKAFVSVTEATTYTATYLKTYIDYTIRFVNDDDASTLLDEQTLHYGEVITYKGTTPEKEATAQYKYEFSGWSDGYEDGVTTVSGNKTYTAQYEAKTQKYTVTFLEEENGAEIKHVTVAYGADATAAAPAVETLTPPSDDKRFGGWSGDITYIVGPTTVWPIWKDKIYVVVFYDPIAEAEIDRFEDVEHGDEVLPPTAPAHDGYEFKGWDSDAYKSVTDDLVINAVYEEAKSGLNTAEADVVTTKAVIDGQVVIIRNGKKYNMLGAEIK